MLLLCLTISSFGRQTFITMTDKWRIHQQCLTCPTYFANTGIDRSALLITVPIERYLMLQL